MRARADTLELAILGLLGDAPMHGYELRKRLGVMFGPLRAFSYGSLYPSLKQLVAAGLIETPAGPDPESRGSSRRAKIVYQLTAKGKERLEQMLAESGPASWEDDRFDVHFAFFASTDAETRLRVLEGRRTRMAERLELMRSSFTRMRDRLDDYTLELQRHGLEQVEREVNWLDGLITAERRRGGERAANPTVTRPLPTDNTGRTPATH